MELTGLVGWRGMVGSVLLDRMQADLRAQQTPADEPAISIHI